jgi:hypothetical protein
MLGSTMPASTKAETAQRFDQHCAVKGSVQENVMFVPDAVCLGECAGSVWLSVRSWVDPA